MGGGPEPVAVVGIGCRLPGGVDDPDSLWSLLIDGADAITEIPDDRFARDLFDERAATPGRIMSRWGGFVDGLDGFDAGFFETSPREAERLDPQQRLLLETTCEALDDAGIPRSALAGSSAGVFVGMWLNEYEARMYADTDAIDFHMTTGTGRYAASGRLSFFLDLLGPSITIDTACSSSLVAVHLASESLARGECDVALAGGANAIVEPFITVAYSQSKMMAPDGHCKFGDAAANGYVRSDGSVMIALKRLADAQADGDRVYAVIRGSAVTNDGRSSGFLATPGRAGQENMLRRAYERAGVAPDTVQYVEAHGTGTAAGDPVEVGALGSVVGAGTRSAPCLVGSIKSNIGHTEGAAGAAGLAKLALALHHGTIPASLHVEQPNPDIPWDDLAMQVSSTPQPWPTVDGPRRGGVSAFGIAGTNAHAVLEEAPAAREPAQRDARPSDVHILAVSAADPGALRELAERHAALLDPTSASTADVAPETLAEHCAAAATRRDHLAERVAVVGGDGAELGSAVRKRVAEIGDERGRSGSGRRVVFVCSGQGSQWTGMHRELLATEPVYAEAMDACDRAIRAEAAWSPIEMLSSSESSGRLDDIDVVQPLLFAVQVSLAALWRSWGITPSAVVGHSMGEVAAAHIAGALDLDDAVKVICRRSALLLRIAGDGAMGLVDLSVEDARAAIAGRESSLSIAVSNSPRSTVISGDPVELREVLDALTAREVFCRPVKVDVASHSPQVDPLLGELREQLASIRPRPTDVPFRSTALGTPMDGTDLDADYWASNVRNAVMFGDAVAELVASEPAAFLELSPHPVLLPSIEQILADTDDESISVALGTTRRDEPERAAMLESLARLYEAGAEVDWQSVTGGPRRHVSLPRYPWQHERHWFERRVATRKHIGGHPLLGHGTRPASDLGTVHWQRDIGTGDFDFLTDHTVQGSALFPATGFIELMRAAADAGDGPVSLHDVALHEALPVGPSQATRLQVEATPTSCRVYARSDEPGTADGEQDAWRLHADGSCATAMPSPPASLNVEDIRKRCTTHRDRETHVADMASRGLGYGNAFQPVADVWVGQNEAIGHIESTRAAGTPWARRITTLDGCLQIALAALPAVTAGATYVPVGIEQLTLDAVDDAAWSHAEVTQVSHGSAHVVVTVADADGRTVAACRGLEFRRIGSPDLALGHLFYDLDWTIDPAPDETVSESSAGPGTWVVYADAAAGAGDELVDRLRSNGNRCIVARPGEAFGHPSEDEFVLRPTATDDHRALAAAATPDGRTLTGVAYTWAMSVAADDVDRAETFGYHAPVEMLQAIAGGDDPPRVWLATTGAFGAAPTQSVLWGLGRVAANEYPAAAVTLVDVDTDGARDGERLVADEIEADGNERQISFAAGERRVARLRTASLPARDRTLTASSESTRVAVTAPGTLDSLRTVAQPRIAPSSGEVEVRVEASALNFLDVLKAMGICPGIESSPGVALGAECAGVVTAVGDGVDHVAVGDAVGAITSSYRATSLLASHVTLPGALVRSNDAGLSAEDMATIPVAYVTAYYSLCELARIRAGETVLVHSATGGVGLAAIELCRHLGVDVIATAGSDAKRAHLHTLGIEHVFDSRTTDFAAEIHDVTAGRGVDVVLNSLVGDAIAAGFASLAPGGRFVEIGKRDVYGHSRLDLALFKRNIALFVVDLADLTEHDPAEVGRVFATVMELVAAGSLPPLPFTRRPMADAAAAFRTMAQAGHIGKLVLDAPAGPVDAEVPAIRADSTYVITGGHGGLGLAVAANLVDRGARHLALLGRSAPSGEVQQAIAELGCDGVEVVSVAGDVGDATSLRRALDEVRDSMPAIRGIVHAAGVLADATIATMDTQRARAALVPKLHGAWNLHQSTLDDPLDHFVLFSSVAGVLGLAGQSNYAAGNAALDALAVHRRSLGRPARSIQWGPWAEIGLAAAAAERGGRLDDRGLVSLDPSDAIAAFDLLLDAGGADVAVMDLDVERWRTSQPLSGTLLDRLGDTSSEPGSTISLADHLAALPAGARRRRAMEDALRDELAAVLRVEPDRIQRDVPMKSMGLDSLMALELRNRLESMTALTLSGTVAWNYPTLTLLGEHIAERMAIPLAGSTVVDHEVDASQPDLPTSADDATSISDTATNDDLAALLAAELAAVDALLDDGGGAS